MLNDSLIEMQLKLLFKLAEILSIFERKFYFSPHTSV